MRIEPLSISSATRIVAETPGPRALILGGIHGNEPCGVFAISRLLEAFSSEKLRLKQGELLLVHGNEEAGAANVRYCRYNLNRLFRDDAVVNDTRSYEVKRAEEIKAVIKSVDCMLDLHSTSGFSTPYLLCEKHLLEESRKIGIQDIVVGWGDLGDESLAGDTETYSHRFGVSGFTLECGQHHDKASSENAFNFARQFLSAYGLIDFTFELPKSTNEYFLTEIQVKEDDSFQYARQFRNLETVAAGELIGKSSSKEYRAPYLCSIVLPSPAESTRPGEDLYLLAQRKSQEMSRPD